MSKNIITVKSSVYDLECTKKFRHLRYFFDHRREKMSTVGDLIKMTRLELKLRSSGVGEMRLNELEKELASHGLHLGLNLVDPNQKVLAKIEAGVAFDIGSVDELLMIDPIYFEKESASLKTIKESFKLFYDSFLKTQAQVLNHSSDEAFDEGFKTLEDTAEAVLARYDQIVAQQQRMLDRDKRPK